MFERLARQEQQEAAHVQRHDVFKEATEEEMRKQSESKEINQVKSSTEVNGHENVDVEMQEDEKGGIKC